MKEATPKEAWDGLHGGDSQPHHGHQQRILDLNKQVERRGRERKPAHWTVRPVPLNTNE